MKTLKILLLGMMLVYGASAEAFQVQGRPCPAGGGGIAAGTILAGTNTVYGSEQVLSSKNVGLSAYTALYSDTPSKAYYYVPTQGSALPARYVICDTSYNILLVSDEKATISIGWNEFTFSSTYNLVAGTTYRIGVVFSENGKRFRYTTASGSFYSGLVTYFPSSPLTGMSLSASWGLSTYVIK